MKGRMRSRLGVWFMGVLARLPLPVLRALGWVLGQVLYVLAVPRRRVALANLALCYPDASPAQRSAWGARVTDIRSIDRKRDGYRIKGTVVVNERGGGWGRDYNYRYRGRNYDQGKFSCDVRYGRVVDVDFSGLRNYR